MTIASSLGGMFAAASDWWSEKTFWLYYYGFSQDPKDILNSLPVSAEMIEKLSAGIERSRANLLASTAARVAGGENARPSASDMAGKLLIQARPALDIALRTGLNSPLRLVLFGAIAILACDTLYGGHLRETIAGFMASFNSESGKANQTPPALHDEAPAPQSYKHTPLSIYFV